MDDPQSLDTDKIAKDATIAARLVCDTADIQAQRVLTQADITLRQHAFILSSIVTLLVLSSYIYFAWEGKHLIIPEIVWCIILAPWFGAGGGKLVDIIAVLTAKKNGCATDGWKPTKKP